MPSPRAVLAAVGLLVVAVTTGCGSDDKPSEVAGSEAAGGSGPVLLGQADAGRKVVYTAELDVRVSSVGKATTAAVEETKRAGGHLFSQTAEKDSRTADLILKVPSDRFEPLLSAISGLGHVLRRSVKAQDVTAEVVDVEGRLKNAQTSAERLRTLLAESKNVADVVAVEAELTKREADIESLQGRRRVLADQVDLATATVRLTERNDLEVSDDLPGFLDAFRSGGVALVNVGLAALVAVGFALPFTPLIAAGVWLRRRWRRRHPKPPRPRGGGTHWPVPPPPAGGTPEPAAGSATATDTPSRPPEST